MSFSYRPVRMRSFRVWIFQEQPPCITLSLVYAKFSRASNSISSNEIMVLNNLLRTMRARFTKPALSEEEPSDLGSSPIKPAL